MDSFSSRVRTGELIILAPQSFHLGSQLLHFWQLEKECFSEFWRTQEVFEKLWRI
jgi:hypothetical protein